jgi:hypothetical protein
MREARYAQSGSRVSPAYRRPRTRGPRVRSKRRGRSQRRRGRRGSDPSAPRRGRAAWEPASRSRAKGRRCGTNLRGRSPCPWRGRRRSGRRVVHHPLVIDHLPDEVRGIKVEAEVRRRNRIEHLVPECDSHAERLRGVDDFEQVRVHLFAVCGVWMEVIRVVRERRDLQSVPTEQFAHRVRVERVHDVSDARVTPALAAGSGPTRSRACRSLPTPPSSQPRRASGRERSSQEPELHPSTSTSIHRLSRELSAIASPRTFSQ